MVTELARKTIPTGLAAGDPRELYLCGLASRTLDRFEIGTDGRVPATGEPIAGDCTLAVAVLEDGRIATASETAIRVVEP